MNSSLGSLFDVPRIDAESLRAWEEAFNPASAGVVPSREVLRSAATRVPQPFDEGGLPHGWVHVVGLQRPTRGRAHHLVRTCTGWGILGRWFDVAQKARQEVLLYGKTLGDLISGVIAIPVPAGFESTSPLGQVLSMVARAYLPLCEDPDGEELLMALNPLHVPEVVFEEIPALPPGDIAQEGSFLVLSSRLNAELDLIL